MISRAGVSTSCTHKLSKKCNRGQPREVGDARTVCWDRMFQDATSCYMLHDSSAKRPEKQGEECSILLHDATSGCAGLTASSSFVAGVVSVCPLTRLHAASASFGDLSRKELGERCGAAGAWGSLHGSATSTPLPQSLLGEAVDARRRRLRRVRGTDTTPITAPVVIWRVWQAWRLEENGFGNARAGRLGCLERETPGFTATNLDDQLKSLGCLGHLDSIQSVSL
jgi:hypothetical protein